MATSTYRQNSRAEGVAYTRQRIILAARQLFLSAGFHRVSIETIAARAGVGRTTVFQQFGSKAGLLHAVEQETSSRAGVDELQKALADPDALGSLRAAFEVGCHVWAAERGMFRNLFSLAVIDPEMRAVMTQKDEKRRQLVDALAQQLQRQHRLRPGVTRRSAADLLWLLTSFETFDTLLTVRGSVKEVSRLLLGQVAAFVDL